MELSLLQLLNQARQFEPSLSVYCDNRYGQVSIRGKIVLDTQGFAAESVISGFLSGFINANLIK
jgi:hypothetical protein